MWPENNNNLEEISNITLDTDKKLALLWVNTDLAFKRKFDSCNNSLEKIYQVQETCKYNDYGKGICDIFKNKLTA